MAVHHGISLDEDLFSLHEGLLGRKVPELLSDFAEADSLTLRGAGKRTMASLQRMTGRVAATLTGVAGDSGMPTGSQFLFSTGATRNRFLRSEDAYRRHRVFRHVFRGVSQSTIAESAFIVTTTATGLDNRGPIPPFLPCFLGEDTLFGVALSKVSLNSFVGCVPASLIHAPDKERLCQPLPVSLEVAGLLAALLTEIPVWRSTVNVVDRMRSIGRQLIELGSLDQTTFADLVSESVVKNYVTTIGTYEEHLRRYHSQPDYWASEICEWINRLHGAAASEYLWVPREFAHMSLAAAAASTRKIVYDFGRLLLHWPEIFDVCKGLRGTNRGIARPLYEPV